MNEKNKAFVDPLDELIKQHMKANNVPETTAEEVANPEQEAKIVSDVNDDTVITDSESKIDTNEINYGDNDLEEEIKAEDATREEIHAEAIEKKHEIEQENQKNQLPPLSLDKDFQKSAIDFQGNKLEIVASMVKRVTDKHGITSGMINPEKEFQIMGDLIDIYHNTGSEVITPEFEDLIISNWIYPDNQDVNDAQTSDTKEISETSTEPNTNKEKVEEKETTNHPVININVKKDNPVTINVDDAIVNSMEKSQALDIYVKEVTEKELKATTIIENSNRDGIIKPYDSGLNDVPLTLPMSGYRCVMRPINWFDFIKLSSPSSGNATDAERKKWSVIYDHMKNVSIGEFKDFEDFLKKTKYSDRELLMWGILIGTADEEETISITCSNPKCHHDIKAKYYPRTIIRLDEKLVPKYYTKLHDVSVGEESYKLWADIAGSRRRYKLPNTGIIVEINEPSAYEFITEKLELTQKLYERYRPGEKMGTANLNDEATQAQLIEFEYLAGNALLVSAMSIPDEKGNEYRYTNWEDIEKIITTALDAEDSAILLQIIAKARTKYVSPITFKLDDIECEYCKHVNDNLVIEDIAETLLFQVSRRLANTNINLIEMP